MQDLVDGGGGGIPFDDGILSRESTLDTNL
jgi:hypothetical protein